MTKKLQELFDLPKSEPESEPEETVAALPEDDDTTVNPVLVTTETMNNLVKIDEALPSIKGLEAADSEMDEIAALAISSYKDLVDLGMNVEARIGSEIFSSASQFLGHAITAKNSKINKKLKMIDLQLKKAKLDADKLKNNPESVEPGEGQGHMLDRNELLAEVLAAAKKDKES